MVIAIAGGSASGKTTLLSQLANDFDQNLISFISCDNYYRDQGYQSKDKNGAINYDLPTALDVDRLIQDITSLKAGKSIAIKEYTFNNPTAIPKIIQYQPTPIIVIEGLFVLYEPKLKPFLDFKVFVDAPEDIRLSRRLKRDVAGRDYSESSIMYQWKNHVLPAYQTYLEPYKSMADMKIDTQLTFEADYEKLKAFLRKQL
jgi:uridine kinase